MNKNDARKIAETITNQQIQDMFNKAKENITDWGMVSSVNKGITKGTAWNILTRAFDVDKKLSVLAATNMIWEFGDYLNDDLKPKKIPRKKRNIQLTHQEPIFNVEKQKIPITEN